MRRRKQILETTTNRGVFNRAYKMHLGIQGDIRCSYCGYHRGENFGKKNYYGGLDDNLRYPSWKLATRNRKQWMPKKLKIVTEKDGYGKYVKYTEIVV